MSRVCSMYLSELKYVSGTLIMRSAQLQALYHWTRRLGVCYIATWLAFWEKWLFLLDWLDADFFLIRTSEKWPPWCIFIGVRLFNNYYCICNIISNMYMYIVHTRVFAKLAQFLFIGSELHMFGSLTLSDSLPKKPFCKITTVYSSCMDSEGFWTAVLGMKVRVLFTLCPRAKMSISQAND